MKKHFLGKHQLDVERFYRKIIRLDCKSEEAVKCKHRFVKNRNKLFTFLGHDGVPWHNNNAEHAVKAFAMLRQVIDGVTSCHGLNDYLVLISLAQTCKYRRIDFLSFLLSGEADINAYAHGEAGINFSLAGVKAG